ncbi:hypothetical protein ACI1T5_01000 [Lactococcus petauri]|uniref:hypothetical protein n=1 Tax=Lactococcus petauri TaxID=1940789 RepID=UPI0002E26E1B|nr:hypothetical protein [Lactococcus petauri]APC44680.1 hypothetical protein [Lactococcus phage PLg-TB25]MDT2620598.1 hypothetical protein [Lactococcus petauri]
MENYDSFITKEVNKNNIEDLIFECTAPLAKIILTREYYSGKNKEIKEFTKKYLNEDYRDYLFHSRPMLYARIIKDLIKVSKNNEDYEIENKIEKIKNIQRFLSEKTNQYNSSDIQTKKYKNDPIEGWRNIINPRS